jgi:hypothetical protein
MPRTTAATAAPADVANKSKKPRGANAKWSKAEVDSLIEQLIEAKDAGNTAEGGFKSTVWSGVANSFDDPLKKKVRACESKWTRLKKDYKEIKWLREEVSGFGWNDDTQMVDATDEVWEELRKVLFYILIL